MLSTNTSNFAIILLHGQNLKLDCNMCPLKRPHDGRIMQYVTMNTCTAKRIVPLACHELQLYKCYFHMLHKLYKHRCSSLALQKEMVIITLHAKVISVELNGTISLPH